MNSKKLILLSSIILGAIFSLGSLAYRYKVEAAYRATELLMEMSAIRNVAASSGTTTTGVLALLKPHGLTGVAISEETLGDLIDQQRVSITQRTLPQPRIEFETTDQETINRVQFAIEARFGIVSGQVENRAGLFHLMVLGEIPGDQLRTLSLGLNPSDAKAARDAQMRIVVRHSNPQGASSRFIRAMLKHSRTQGAEFYLPQGEQVLGSRDLIPVTAETMQQLGMFLARPEFVKMAGDAKLAKASQDRLLLLHSIQSVEADRLAPGEVIERFSKAARERNVRLLLLRPLNSSDDNPIQGLAGTLDKIANRLRSEGVPLGRARPFPDPKVPTLIFPLIGICASVVAAWVSISLFKHPLLLALSLVGALAIFVCSFTSHREISALGAAIVYPIAAYLLLVNSKPQSIFGSYLLISLVSLSGGLAVAGLLNDLSYYVRVDQFFAVKLAHFLPILVIGYLLFSRRMSFASLAKMPVTYGVAALSIMVLIALLFMMARTGNDNPAAVSGFEIRFRSLMDTLLFTRPRTKEFLFGHPAMVIGLFLFAASNQRREASSLGIASALMLTLGAIGQTSIVNTMCHLHTPITLSIARIATGWVLGGLIGGILWLFIKGLIKTDEEAAV